MSRFKVGDKVRKVKGYPFVGTVVMVNDRDEKCSVRHRDGWEHIFNDGQLGYDHPEYQYLDLLREVTFYGDKREGRNGTVRSLFGRQIRFDLEEGFPLVTTKKVNFRNIVVELLWFLKGDTNVKYLHDHDVHIWDQWVGEDGELGPIYGKQWRDFNGVDQIYNVCQSLINDPYSRRHVVSAWNPAEVDSMALPPCHTMFQFHVSDGRLNCQLYQRSCDAFIGGCYNIASYALLTHLIAKEVDLMPGEFIHTFGDVHVYEDQIPAISTQLERRPRPMPDIGFRYSALDKMMFELTPDDIELFGYDPHPFIAAPVSA